MTYWSNLGEVPGEGCGRQQLWQLKLPLCLPKLLPKRVKVLLLVATLSCGCSSPLFAKGFSIDNARIELKNKVYLLSADLNFEFSGDVLEAINNGVPMILVLDIELLRPRKYIWDDDLAELEQRYQLQYHALSEQYIVRNINSGAQYTFFSLDSALNKIGRVKDLPVIDEQLLVDRDKYKYYARIKTHIDFENLPVPLHLNALISSSWWLGSDWYNLDL